METGRRTKFRWAEIITQLNLETCPYFGYILKETGRFKKIYICNEFSILASKNINNRYTNFWHHTHLFWQAIFVFFSMLWLNWKFFKLYDWFFCFKIYETWQDNNLESVSFLEECREIEQTIKKWTCGKKCRTINCSVVHSVPYKKYHDLDKFFIFKQPTAF